jgi:ubiquitin-like modifier-activating enzyme ATG7
MKWRLLPELDIPAISKTRCLMFGSGTLGCQMARNLIGWGVKKITFVDNGKVSYSNPVRQSLYNYEDSICGGKNKAETAAEALKRIFPDLDAQGFTVNVPMPGHFVTTEEDIVRTLKNLDLVEQLVADHDAIFLLMDSREARWLPTVLANKYQKICITVALGFDSFVVIRHGISPRAFVPERHRERLGCYFCNDVLAPANTMKDRTLDQQCTVTRPGLSFVSSGYASELLINLLHHPEREGCPAS